MFVYKEILLLHVKTCENTWGERRVPSTALPPKFQESFADLGIVI